MTLKYKDIHWADNIRQLVNIVLSLPVGSVDAERGFSILKNTLDHRKSLTPDHLQAILFIRINGPPVDKFDSASYTRHWLDTGHMRSDDKSWKTKGRPRKTDDQFSESLIF